MSELAPAAIVGAALFLSSLLVHPVRRGPEGASAADSGPEGRRIVRPRGPWGPAEDLQSASLLVAQISALLRAGRSPAQLWAQAAEIHGAAHGGDGTCRIAAPALRREGRAGRLGPAPATWDETSSRVLAAAAHAASLGRPVAPAIRTEAGVDASRSTERSRGARGRSAAIWGSVAACIETSEASGSPLAAVLDRLAAQFESDADAAAARSVALAGPKATAKVLSMLPVAGLGLGILMGVDPLGLLLSTPLGAACLTLGSVLTLLGRWWSSRLVSAASEER